MTEGTPADPGVRPPDRTPVFGSTVTILFSDIRGFSEYTDHYGDEAGYRLVELHKSIVEEQFKLHRGHVVKTQGDSFMVSFDSARTAVTCAIAIQRELEKLHRERGATIQVGVGINVGEPLRAGEDFFGRAVNLASRICSVAGPGQILVSYAARELAGKIEGITFVDQGEYELKGFLERQRLYSVDWSGIGQKTDVAPMVVEAKPSPEMKGHAIAAAASPAALKFDAQPHARRAVSAPMLIIAAFVAVVIVISGVVGVMALTRRGAFNGNRNLAATSSSPSPTHSAAVFSPSESGLPPPTGAPTRLGDLPTKSRAFNSTNPISFHGNTQPDALGFVFNNPQVRYSPGEADYDLGGRFERFQSQVLQDDQSTIHQVRFTVFGDDRRLGEAIVGPGVSKNLDIDITGVQTLSLVATFQPPDGCCGNAYFVSATLFAAKTVTSPPATFVTLRTLDATGDRPADLGPVQASGKPYVDAIGFAFTNPQAVTPAQVKYTLAGRYQRLTLTELVTDNSENSATIEFTILGDGKLLNDTRLSAGSVTPPLDLGVGGVQTLTVIVNASACCVNAALVDSALS